MSPKLGKAFTVADTKFGTAQGKGRHRRDPVHVWPPSDPLPLPDDLPSA
jgi:hypothetical protein